MRPAWIGAGLAALVGASALLLSASARPELELRSTAWLVQTGHTFAAAPPGQGFARPEGLSRVELLVTDLGEAPPAELELVVRRGGPRGDEVRRVAGSSFRRTPLGGWLGFEFEPLSEEGGVTVHVELQPAGEREWSHVAVWTRLRGNPGGRWQWGSDTRKGPVVEGEFLSEQPDLRGLAFACRRVEGPLELVLLDGEGGAELARSSLTLGAPVVDGWIAFPLDVQPESRWRDFAYRLELSPGDELVAVGRVPTITPWHGSGEVDSDLTFATSGGVHVSGRDLILRAWGSPGPGRIVDDLIVRMSPALIPFVLLWLAACALLWSALPRKD